MSSRFFATGDTESESSSESENEETFTTIRQPTRGGFISDSDDEDDVKRVVKSAKDKVNEEMASCVKNMRNHMKIGDWNEVLNDFDKLNKALAKTRKGIDAQAVPRLYTKAIIDLEELIKVTLENKEDKKKLSSSNAKSLTALKQKVKKNRRDFEDEIAAYMENPDASDDEDGDDDDDSDSDSDSEEESRPAFASGSKFARGGAASDSDSDDSIDWDESESDSDESADEDGVYGVSYFLKKTDDDKSKKEKKKKEPKKKRIVKEVVSDVEEEAPRELEEKPLFPEKTEITFELVHNKLMEIVSQRGKKSTDRKEQLNILRRLRALSDEHNLGTGLSLKFLFHIISATFDSTPSIAQHMTAEKWNSCLADMTEVVSMLENNRDTLTVTDKLSDDEENLGDPSKQFVVLGSIVGLVERLDDEFTKHLQSIDPHTTEYIDRLRDEFQLLAFITRVQKYCETTNKTSDICRIYLRVVEHLYYKTDFEALKDNENVESGPVKKAHASHDLIDRLCKYLYTKDTTDRIRTRAMLCHIYHHALHDRWYEARDLILMSHLQETVQHSDVPTQILFNRAMVQVGLCAFRNGLMKDAHGCLHDICAGGRVKELIAQGIINSRHSEKNPEQEKLEKRRQVPFHMHINSELLECVYLTTSMLLEIPNMAANAHDHRRRVISKAFRRLYEFSSRQVFSGPPENTRDHVIAGARALARGDWRKTRDLVLGLKVWNLFSNPEAVKDMIQTKIQEEGIRTYLFSYCGVYDSVSMVTISEMFELPEKTVHSIVSKMMINEELSASWDQPTKSIILHKNESTRLQHLTLIFAEKANNLVEQNERLFELKNTGYGNVKDGQRQQKGGRQYHDNNRNNQSGGRNYSNRGHRHGGQRGGHSRGYTGNRGDGGNRGGNQNYRGGNNRRGSSNNYNSNY
eukprot:Nk52_evm10s356 gene=Nk52_evmTU10s356